MQRVGHQESRGPQTHDLPRLPLGRRPSPTEARADSRQANGLSAIVHTRLHSSLRHDYPQPESHLYTKGVFPVLGGRLASECHSDHTGSLWAERPGEDTCPVLGDLRAVAAGVWASSLNVRGPSPFLKKQLPPHGKEAGTVHESDAGGGGRHVRRVVTRGALGRAVHPAGQAQGTRAAPSGPPDPTPPAVPKERGATAVPPSQPRPLGPFCQSVVRSAALPTGPDGPPR